MSAYARHAPRRSVDSGHPRAPYPDEQYHGAHGDYATPNGGQNGGLDYSNEPDAFYDSYYDEAAPGVFTFLTDTIPGEGSRLTQVGS